MEIMAIMVTIIKGMEDMVATIILVTITDMVTTTVSGSIGEHPTSAFIFTIFRSGLYWFVDQSGGYGKSPRRGGHTNSYKPY